jgi:uncharacterized protein YqjF (DUF2071 family)
MSLTDALTHVFEQVYEHLLLVHWPVPEDALRAALPAGVDPVPFEGRYWVGHDVYLGTHGRVLGVPIPAVFDSSPIVTLRTIVDVRGVRGLFLLSMDLPGLLIAALQRNSLHVRCHDASVTIAEQAGEVRVACQRREGDGASLLASYRPSGPAAPPAPGSRDLFLLGGDRLYAGEDGQLLAIDVVHGPWQLAPATLRIDGDTIPASCGLPAPGPDLVAMYQRAQTAQVALPKPL